MGNGASKEEEAGKETKETERKDNDGNAKRGRNTKWMIKKVKENTELPTR